MGKPAAQDGKSFSKATQPVGGEVRIQTQSAADRPTELDPGCKLDGGGAQWGPSLANAMQSVGSGMAGVWRSQETLPKCWRHGGW